jgi:hypothetical protein
MQRTLPLYLVDEASDQAGASGRDQVSRGTQIQEYTSSGFYVKSPGFRCSDKIFKSRKRIENKQA